MTMIDERRGRARCTYGKCTKLIYDSRREARRAAKLFHPDKRMAVYKCRDTPGYVDTRWHVGNVSRY